MAYFKHFMLITFVTLCMLSHAQLDENYYKQMCPNLEEIVKSIVGDEVSKESHMGVSLLQLHFHDCFVNGCDGSVLLDTVGGEKESVHNVKSLRGFEIIDSIKAQVEQNCSGIVSCADILALTARESVHLLGGPTWTVKLGRRDSITGASSNSADMQLPFAIDNLDKLITLFTSKGFSVQDFVALSGAHTIGSARCVRFRDRIYRETNIEKSFAQSLQKICPSNRSDGDDNLAPLDTQTPTKFDNAYYVNLVSLKGLLHSDQVLFNGGETDNLVQLYASDVNAFYKDFEEAMVKMSQLNVSTGYDGIIRTNCRVSD